MRIIDSQLGSSAVVKVEQDGEFKDAKLTSENKEDVTWEIEDLSDGTTEKDIPLSLNPESAPDSQSILWVL